MLSKISWVAMPLLVVGGMGTSAAPAAAQTVAKAATIVLPGATSAEGIAKGDGTTFYAGDLFLGDIYRGDIKEGEAELFIDAPDGRQAVGMAFDEKHDLLFVAGGFTGQGYVYDTETGETVATYQFSTTLINDVAVTRKGAWFTDTNQAQLYFVPIDPYGDLGEFTTLALSGPAADTGDMFNNNGIQATEDGKTLIVAHTGNAALYTVNPEDGTSALIEGVSVPNVDGIVLDGRRLWAVQNFSDQVSRIKLSHDLSSGEVKKVITSKHFVTPSTAALFGDTLAVVNAKFITGFPPTADEYEVVLVRA